MSMFPLRFCFSQRKRRRRLSTPPPIHVTPARPLIASRFEVMQDRRTRIERHAGGPGRAGIVAGAVPAALRRRHHIARIADEILLAFDLHADMALHDEPELGPADMEVALAALAIVIRNRGALAAQDVG